MNGTKAEEQQKKEEELLLNKFPTVGNAQKSIVDGDWNEKLQVRFPKYQLNKIIIRKTHTDFQTAGTSKDITLFYLPKYGEILTTWFNVPTAFAGPATYTISIGKDTDEDGLQTAQNVKTTGLKLAVGTDFTANRPIYSTSDKTEIQAQAVSTVNNLDQSTAGIVDFHIVYIIHGEANL